MLMPMPIIPLLDLLLAMVENMEIFPQRYLHSKANFQLCWTKNWLCSGVEMILWHLE